MEARTWVKMAGSDTPVPEYPTMRVNSEPGCTCDHPIHPHYHFKEDRTQPPVRYHQPIPIILEDNGDGTHTQWGYTVWGSVGFQGTLKPEVKVVPISTKADRAEVTRIESMMERALRSQNALVTAMQIARAR